MSQIEKLCRHHSNRTGIDRLFFKKRKKTMFHYTEWTPYAYLVWKIESVENDSQKNISIWL